MKKNLCKIIACIVGVMAFNGFNMADVKAETNFEPTFEQNNVSAPFSVNTDSKILQHPYYVWRKSTNTRIIENYQTTYWVYGGGGIGFYQSAKNTIWNIDPNAEFLNGRPIEDNVNGKYTYGGDVYYQGVYRDSVLFITSINSTGGYSYSSDPVVYF